MIDIVDDTVGFLLRSELGSPLGALPDYENLPPVGLQLIMDIPPGSKVRHPDLMVSPLQATIAVPPSGSC